MVNCKDCKFRVGDQCLRYPPQVYAREGEFSDFYQAYPVIDMHDACGEGVVSDDILTTYGKNDLL